MKIPFRIGLRGVGLVACLSTASLGAAQETAQRDTLATSPLVSQLESCTAIADDTARLTCFDREVNALVGATKEGDVKVVETEEITEARKKLFGYNVPDAGIFGAQTDEEKEASKRLTSTVTKVRQISSNEWHIWIEEGNARWRMKNTSIRFRAPQVGDSVEFKPATMGTYWIRVNGRTGVRGNRVG